MINQIYNLSKSLKSLLDFLKKFTIVFSNHDDVISWCILIIYFMFSNVTLMNLYENKNFLNWLITFLRIVTIGPKNFFLSSSKMKLIFILGSWVLSNLTGHYLINEKYFWINSFLNVLTIVNTWFFTLGSMEKYLIRRGKIFNVFLKLFLNYENKIINLTNLIVPSYKKMKFNPFVKTYSKIISFDIWKMFKNIFS